MSILVQASDTSDAQQPCLRSYSHVKLKRNLCVLVRGTDAPIVTKDVEEVARPLAACYVLRQSLHSSKPPAVPRGICAPPAECPHAGTQAASLTRCADASGHLPDAQLAPVTILNKVERSPYTASRHQLHPETLESAQPLAHVPRLPLQLLPSGSAVLRYLGDVYCMYGWPLPTASNTQGQSEHSWKASRCMQALVTLPQPTARALLLLQKLLPLLAVPISPSKYYPMHSSALPTAPNTSGQSVHSLLPALSLLRPSVWAS